MTSRADALIQRIAIPPLMREFGEPVTLASGAAITGIFDPIGDSSNALWTEVGIEPRVSQQPNPSVQLRDADASALAERNILTIRDAEYLVVRLDPDGSGLTRVTLMPNTETGIDTDARWQ